MRIRALLFIPALAAAALAFGVSSASAATLFTNAGHGTRVTVGATATATSTGAITLTAPAGSPANSAPQSVLGIRITQNNDAEITATVIHASFVDSTPAPIVPTLGTPWTLTIAGTSSVSGANTSYLARLNNLVFDLAGFGAPFTGSLTTGITATQPTATGSPVTIRLNNAGQVTGNGITGTIDGGYVLGGTVPSTWSLTN
jgi:hypothetical protein